MPLLNFPSTPSLNDRYSYGDRTWEYNGNAWILLSEQLYTSNILEDLNYQFFTNTKAVSAFTAGDSITIDSNGLITATVTAGDPYAFEQANIATVYATSAFDQANTATTYATSAFNAANTKTVAADLTTANVVEDTNLYYTDARVYSNVEQIGYITSASLGGYATNNQLDAYALDTDLTTANVVEDTNLYYTDDRVYSNVTSLGYITASSLSGYATNNQLDAYALDTDLTTANVSEVTNLYYTDARVYSNVTSLGYATNNQLDAYALDTDLTTANVVEDTNLYFTNTRAIYALTAGNNIGIDANGLITSSATGGGGSGGNVTVSATPPSSPNTGDVWIDSTTGTYLTYFNDGDSNQWVEIAASAIYSTDGTDTAVIAGLAYDQANTATTYATSAFDAANTKTVAADLTTANVTEDTNLYFTNTRAVYALTAGNNIGIDSNGLITATITAGDPYAFEQANIATVYATSAFDQANTATTIAQSAFDQANTGGGGGTSGPILLNNSNIDSNVTISSGQNGLAVGPLTLAANVSINIATGQRFIIL